MFVSGHLTYILTDLFYVDLEFFRADSVDGSSSSEGALDPRPLTLDEITALQDTSSIRVVATYTQVPSPDENLGDRMVGPGEAEAGEGVARAGGASQSRGRARGGRLAAKPGFGKPDFVASTRGE